MTNLSERRKYVRVDDQVLMRYERLEDGNQETAKLEKHGGVHFSQKIQSLENQIKVVLPRFEEKHKEWADLFSLLNLKINLIALELSGKQIAGDSGLLARPVSLSACGLAFPAEEKAGVDDDLWIELILQPSMVKICTTARVIACERNSEEGDFPFFIRVEFSELNNDDEESLIQHVIRRESQILKEKRMMREKDENKD